MAGKPRTDLSEREQKFVRELLRVGNQSEAERLAGYPDGSAGQLMKRPLIQAALAKGREIVQKKLSYGLEQAMEQAQEAYEFALQTDNANAAVKAAELRAKLNGLLVEKIDVRQSGFQLVIKGFGSSPPAQPDILTTARPAEDDEDEDDIW